MKELIELARNNQKGAIVRKYMSNFNTELYLKRLSTKL